MPETADKFIPAIEELGSALGAGEALDVVLAEIAEAHGLAPQALRNRAQRTLGNLAAYAVQRAATDRHEREWTTARRQLIAKAAEQGKVMSAEDADAHLHFFGLRKGI